MTIQQATSFATPVNFPNVPATRSRGSTPPRPRRCSTACQLPERQTILRLLIWSDRECSQSGSRDGPVRRRTLALRWPAIGRHRCACRWAEPPARRYRCGSPQELAQPGGALRSRGARPTDADRHRPTTHLEPDVGCSRCRIRWRHLHRHERRSRPVQWSDRRTAAAPLGFHHPSSRQVRVDAVGHGDSGLGHAWHAAGRDHLRLELGAVGAPAAPAAEGFIGS